VFITVTSDKSALGIDGQMFYKNKRCKCTEETAKKVHEHGRDFIIEIGDEKTTNKEYFGEDKPLRKVTETAEIEVKEVEEDVEMSLDEIFEGHWSKQVKKAKEHLKTEEEIEKALQYAIENDVTDGVISKIEDMLNGDNE